MPAINRFQGIIVYLNYADHNPPHFHARFQDEEVTIEIGSRLVIGRMGAIKLRRVLDWMDLHADELARNWALARSRRPLLPIPPLK